MSVSPTPIRPHKRRASEEDDDRADAISMRDLFGGFAEGGGSRDRSPEPPQKRAAVTVFGSDSESDVEPVELDAGPAMPSPSRARSVSPEQPPAAEPENPFETNWIRSAQENEGFDALGTALGALKYKIERDRNELMEELGAERKANLEAAQAWFEKETRRVTSVGGPDMCTRLLELTRSYDDRSSQIDADLADARRKVLETVAKFPNLAELDRCTTCPVKQDRCFDMVRLSCGHLISREAGLELQRRSKEAGEPYFSCPVCRASNKVRIPRWKASVATKIQGHLGGGAE